jgi:Transposase domain (DUF772)
VDNPVRVIDVFVEELDLAELGFNGVEPEVTGRPSYHPSVLLKLYIYGYLNRVQSSRRLEREAGRNVEVMWLTGRLAPDHKTIADFRKDNGTAIRGERHEVVPCALISCIKQFENTKFQAPAFLKIAFDLVPALFSCSSSFETRPQSDIGLLHIVANFSPIERRKRWIGEATPSAPQPLLKGVQILIQSVGHPKAPAKCGFETMQFRTEGKVGGRYATGLSSRLPAPAGRFRRIPKPSMDLDG